jgi:hypothetical protein
MHKPAFLEHSTILSPAAETRYDTIKQHEQKESFEKKCQEEKAV